MDFAFLSSTQDVLERAEKISQLFSKPRKIIIRSDFEIYNPSRASSRMSVINNVLSLCNGAKNTLEREANGKK